jgi:hypothetical protein
MKSIFLISLIAITACSTVPGHHTRIPASVVDTSKLEEIVKRSEILKESKDCKGKLCSWQSSGYPQGTQCHISKRPISTKSKLKDDHQIIETVAVSVEDCEFAGMQVMFEKTSTKTQYFLRGADNKLVKKITKVATRTTDGEEFNAWVRSGSSRRIHDLDSYTRELLKDTEETKLIPSHFDQVTNGGSSIVTTVVEFK